jgi:type IV pilus assembly protein PilY1
MVIPNLWKLADFTYAANHRYFVNGSPIVSDINVGGTWKTILVAGLNGGGRGYYALDITDPAAPELLWEFTPANDGDLGYTFGNPVITKKADGTWVVLVTSGYNNIPEPTNTPVINSGDGKGYLYVLDAGTGSTISKIGTGVGSTSVPSGLAQISTYADKPELDNKAVFTYGGDLLGNVWRFDIDAETVVKFAELKDAGGLGQPITTKPELGNVLTSDGKIRRVVFIGTGKYLETDDLTDTQGQTLYAIKDDDTQTSPATATLVNPRASTASPNRMVQQTITGGTDNRTVTTVTSTNKTDFKVDRGWFVDFPDSGERENVAMQLVLGTLIVPTTVPSSTVCEPGGRGWLNYFNYLTGGPVGNANIVSTSMTAPIVGINVMYIVDPGTGKLVPKVSTVGANDPTPKLIPGTPFSSTGSGFQKKRAIWRELVQ